MSRPATSPAYGDLDPELLAGHDEAFGPDGAPRPAYEPLFAQLSGRDLDELAAAAGRAAAGRGIDFGAGTDRLHVDALPRLVGAEEWASLRAGLGQRARALNEFIADVYGERRIVAAGIVPSSVVESADHFEPDLAGTHPDAALAPVVGFDLVRDADGVLRVLEDNLRTPSGLAYSLAIREALDELGLVAPAERAEPALALDRLAAVLGEGGGRAVMLSDGPGNSAWFEHHELARALDIEICGPGDLTAQGDRVLGGGTEVATVYRRTDEDRLRDDRGELTWVGELLGTALRAGGVRVVNGFGTGVADDKLVHAYVEAMIRFYLDEVPLLASVTTHDLTDDDVRAAVLGRLEDMVIKPRAGLGGHGVVVFGHANAEDRERIAAEIDARPAELIAQERIHLSTHPTICRGELEPRHVDLRVFAVGGEAVPAMLTRMALDRGALVVNSSQDGGLKDTWLLG